MPQISVIIPAYNAEKTLEACLTSLINQTYKDFEIIVVNDRSVDNTLLIAKKYAQVIDLKVRSGAGFARNIGAKGAKAELLAFIDADVILPLNWLGNVIKYMKVNGTKCVAGGYCGSIGSRFIEIFAFYELTYRRRHLPEFVETAVSSNLTCCKDMFFSVKGFPENYLAASLEDMVFSYKISRRCKIFWANENGVYHKFKDSLVKYLRQQFIFARDTVITYLDYPGLFIVRTHQGKLIYLEAATMIVMFVFTYKTILSAPIGIVTLLLLNLKFLFFLGREGSINVYKSFCVILCRTFVAIIGVMVGFMTYLPLKFLRQTNENIIDDSTLV